MERFSSEAKLESFIICTDASIEKNRPSGTIGMSRISSFYLSGRLVRVRHHAHSCRAIIPMTFPVALISQR